MLRFILIFALATQVAYWYNVKDVKPNLAILYQTPTELQTKAFALGDEQAFFRAKALELQMAGDTFGRTTPLKDYDFPLLKKWFFYLDGLDEMSNFVPSMAAYYFARTQEPKETIHILDYLEAHADKHPSEKWWWYSQAIYLANSVLGMKDRALNISKKLRAVEADMPLWARQMEVFMREDLGEKDTAEVIMCEIFASVKNIPEIEMNFMLHFFEERLNTIQEKDAESIRRRCAQLKRRGEV